MSVKAGEAFYQRMKRAGRVAGDSGPAGEAGGKRAREQPERDMQGALFELAAYKEGERSALANLFAVPNGQYRPGSALEPGLRAGVPDVALAAQRGGWPGLFLELKSETGRVRESQQEWIDRLRAEGYAVRVVRSVDEAWGVITSYLDGELETVTNEER